MYSKMSATTVKDLDVMFGGPAGTGPAGQLGGPSGQLGGPAGLGLGQLKGQGPVGTERQGGPERLPGPQGLSGFRDTVDEDPEEFREETWPNKGTINMNELRKWEDRSEAKEFNNSIDFFINHAIVKRSFVESGDVTSFTFSPLGLPVNRDHFFYVTKNGNVVSSKIEPQHDSILNTKFDKDVPCTIIKVNDKLVVQTDDGIITVTEPFSIKTLAVKTHNITITDNTPSVVTDSCGRPCSAPDGIYTLNWKSNTMFWYPYINFRFTCIDESCDKVDITLTGEITANLIDVERKKFKIRLFGIQHVFNSESKAEHNTIANTEVCSSDAKVWDLGLRSLGKNEICVLDRKEVQASKVYFGSNTDSAVSYGYIIKAPFFIPAGDSLYYNSCGDCIGHDALTVSYNEGDLFSVKIGKTTKVYFECNDIMFPNGMTSKYAITNTTSKPVKINVKYSSEKRFPIARDSNGFPFKMIDEFYIFSCVVEPGVTRGVITLTS